VLAAARMGDGAKEEASSLERGARVRVLAGPFAGKVGVVKEVDGKGGAHVMLGLLATRIELKDLSASATGRRPTLSSSHRKPLVLR
jgi:transcription antitermination factor NusG